MPTYARNRSRRGRPARAQVLGTFRDPFSPALGDHLNRNPNKGKHGTARMGLDGFDAETGKHVPTLDEIRAREARRDYRPLTVSTLHDRDRIGRRLPAKRVTRTEYTV